MPSTLNQILMISALCEVIVLKNMLNITYWHNQKSLVMIKIVTVMQTDYCLMLIVMKDLLTLNKNP